MPYEILQDRRVSLKLVEHNTVGRRGFSAGLWGPTIRHKLWTIDYCSFEGMHCKVELGGRESAPFHRPPGTWHVYAPNVGYRQRVDRPDLVLETMWLQFSMSVPVAPLTGRDYLMLADPEERLAGQVRSMYTLQQLATAGSRLALHGMFLAILGEIQMAAHRSGAGTPASPFVIADPLSLKQRDTEGLLHQVDRFVTEQKGAAVSLDKLAQSLHLSVSSLAHRFKAETGMTVLERVRWLRISHARRLLAERNATVKSVARRLGFSSPFYFSRVFSEVTGITPIDYLRQQQKYGRA